MDELTIFDKFIAYLMVAAAYFGWALIAAYFLGLKPA